MIDTARRIGARKQLDLSALRVDAAQVELEQALQTEGDDPTLTNALRKLEKIGQDIQSVGVELKTESR